MATFETYRSITFGSVFTIFFIEILILFLLPNRLLVSLIEKQFNIIRLDKKKFIMNFYGIEVDYLSSRRFRLSLILQLVDIIWIVSIIFMDGWIFRIQHIFEGDNCPLQESDCFNFNNMISNEKIDCMPGHVLTNLTSSRAVCFIWIYKRVTTVDIINQLGIGSAVFSLLCYSFKLFCCWSRKWLGLSLIVLFALGTITVIILTYTLIIYISTMGILLVIGSFAVCINVLQLFQFVRHHQRKIQVT